VLFGMMVLIVVAMVWCHGGFAANYGQSNLFQQGDSIENEHCASIRFLCSMRDQILETLFDLIF
jgi:hypothetical protein